MYLRWIKSLRTHTNTKRKRKKELKIFPKQRLCIFMCLFYLFIYFFFTEYKKLIPTQLNILTVCFIDWRFEHCGGSRDLEEFYRSFWYSVVCKVKNVRFRFINHAQWKIRSEWFFFFFLILKSNNYRSVIRKLLMLLNI